jgi:TolB-like protein/Tfp pilus assembly protein PilF
MENGAGKTSEAPSAPPDSAPVFLSYASQDAEIAKTVCESLEAQGTRCWMAPRDVKPGAQYADEIVRAITEAKALILVMSASAVASAHVGREVERAASKRKQIIVFKVDGAPLSASLEYFLSQSQWIDVPALGMKAALAKLAEATGDVSPSAGVPTTPRPVSFNRTTRRVVIAATILVVLGAAVALGLRFWPGNRGGSTPTASAIPDKSIAVLPFVDMSEKKDQEYFADGMAEEIIDLLAKVPGLKVIGRTSSFQFKGKTEDLRSIGNQLGAAYVLEGSVRKSGDRLRVTAQLISTQDGAHLLSQTYDRDLSDVLKMQDEIATKVVRALQVEVGSAYAVSRPSLRSKEAYALYLRGAHAADRYERPGWEQATSDFQRALELDPSFSEAAAMLANEYDYGGSVGYLTPSEAFRQSKHFAELALKLDPNDARPHVILADYYSTFAWDWTAADRELKQALILAPNDSNILVPAAAFLLTVGRTDEALKQISAAVELDPLEPATYFYLHLVQLRLGRFKEAEAAIRRALEIRPMLAFGQFQLGYVLLARGQPNAALVEFLKEGEDTGRYTGAAVAYFALGRKADSDAALAESIKRTTVFPSGVAGVYAYRRENDEAFKWIDRAYAQKDSLLTRIKFSLEFDNLHDDPRYKAFLKKMNLPLD